MMVFVSVVIGPNGLTGFLIQAAVKDTPHRLLRSFPPDARRGHRSAGSGVPKRELK